MHRAASLYSGICGIALTAMASVATAADCGFDPLGICKGATQAANEAVAGLKEEMELTRKAALQAVDTVTKAVPGERYLQLIDDLNGPDLAKRDAARVFLENLANIDSKAKYELSVFYDFDASKPFHVDFNRFRAPIPLALGTFASTAAVLDTTPADTVLTPPTEAEVRTRLMEIAGKVVDGLTGEIVSEGLHNNGPCKRPGQDIYCAAFSFPNNLFIPELVDNPKVGFPSFEQMNADLAVGPPKHNARRHAVQDTLADLFLSAFSYSELRLSAPGANKDWPLFDGKNFVVFFIDQETYDNHNEDWSIRFNVHDVDNPQRLLFQRPTQTLKRIDFDPQRHTPLLGTNGKKVYWAFREMTGDFAPSPEEVDTLTQIQAALKKYEETVTK